jgi:uncharacterized protein YneF (UPF0154 family)
MKQNNITLSKSITILLLVLIGGFFLTIFITSCSAQKRYKRLIKNHPELVERDTVVVKDTIIKEIKIPIAEYKDSFIIKHDTIIETKKLIISKKGNFFGVTVKPDTLTYRDTIPFEVKVPGKIVTIEKTNFNYIWITLIVGLIMGLLLKRR